MNSDRVQRVLAVLQYDLANDFELHQIDDEGWLVRHAGGFAPICHISDGEAYAVMPSRVVELGTHLDDAEFTRFVEAIRCFQKSTITDYMFRVPPDLVVAKFCQDHPVEGAVLCSLAEHHGIELVAFFGADNYQDGSYLSE